MATNSDCHLSTLPCLPPSNVIFGSTSSRKASSLWTVRLKYYLNRRHASPLLSWISRSFQTSALDYYLQWSIKQIISSSFMNHSLISNYRSWVLFPLERIATYLSWISRRFQTQTRGWVVARNRLWHWPSESKKWAALNPRYVSICKAICKALKAHEIYNNWGSTFLFRDCKKCSDRFSRWG